LITAFLVGDREVVAKFNAMPSSIRSRLVRAVTKLAIELDRTWKVRGCIKERLGQRTDAGPGLLHLARDDQKVGRVARQAVNGRDDYHVAGGELPYQLSKLWPVGGRPSDLFAEHLFATGSLQLGKLAGEVLGVGRNAGIAVNHAPISAIIYLTKAS
jgi:hypothetical protein